MTDRSFSTLANLCGSLRRAIASASRSASSADTRSPSSIALTQVAARAVISPQASPALRVYRGRWTRASAPSRIRPDPLRATPPAPPCLRDPPARGSASSNASSSTPSAWRRLPDAIEATRQRLHHAKRVCRASRFPQYVVRSFEVPDLGHQAFGCNLVAALGSIHFDQLLSERRVVLGVPEPQAVCSRRIDREAFGAVLANRPRAERTDRRGSRSGRVDERLEALEVSVANALDCRQVDAADEHGETPEERSLIVRREQVVAPAESQPEASAGGSNARGAPVPAAAADRSTAAAAASLAAATWDARRGELDRQGQPVQAAADLADRGSSKRVEFAARARRRARSIGLARAAGLGRPSRRRCGAGPARHQDVASARASSRADGPQARPRATCSKLSSRAGDPSPSVRPELSTRTRPPSTPSGLEIRGNDERRIAERRERGDEEDPVRERLREPPRELDREPGLADPAGRSASRDACASSRLGERSSSRSRPTSGVAARQIAPATRPAAAASSAASW